MMNAVFRDVAPCGLAKTDVSEVIVSSVFRIEEIYASEEKY
jgi:hypothetical protein